MTFSQLGWWTKEKAILKWRSKNLIHCDLRDPREKRLQCVSLGEGGEEIGGADCNAAARKIQSVVK